MIQNHDGQPKVSWVILGAVILLGWAVGTDWSNTAYMSLALGLLLGVAVLWGMGKRRGQDMPWGWGLLFLVTAAVASVSVVVGDALIGWAAGASLLPAIGLALVCYGIRAKARPSNEDPSSRSYVPLILP